tara:strand:+ start:448 stop:1041 length:594 start_codon:yes stop_codon:yes gene_type:complete
MKGILLSGGMDSISLAYWKRPNWAFTVDYGQHSAKAEITAAHEVTKQLRISHRVINVDCSSIGSGDLINKSASDLAPESDWWPYRNQLLVTLVAGVAVNLGVEELMVGSVKNDNYHKDGSPEFYSQLSKLMELQEGNLQITAPAINLTAAELISTSKVPTEVLSWAHSCHKGNIPCRNCRGCNKYFSEFKALGENVS